MLGRGHWFWGGCIEKGEGALGMGRVHWERGLHWEGGNLGKVRVFWGVGSYIEVLMSSLEGTELKKCIGREVRGRVLQVRFGHVEKWDGVGDWTLALHTVTQ